MLDCLIAQISNIRQNCTNYECLQSARKMENEKLVFYYQNCSDILGYFKSFSWSLKQFIQTVKGQNYFW